MLDYVAYVTIRTGQINRCSAPQYNTPSNGVVVDDGISLDAHPPYGAAITH